MPHSKGKTPDGDRVSGYIREVADAAKAGVDQASEYLEDVTDRTVDYVQGTVSETRDKVAELGNRPIGDLWADALRYTKRQPAAALLVSVSIGLALGLMVRRGR